MNYHIKTQVTNMITMVKTFQSGCEMAATKDDGKIDKEEEKILKQITKATERFIKELSKIE